MFLIRISRITKCWNALREHWCKHRSVITIALIPGSWSGTLLDETHNNNAAAAVVVVVVVVRLVPLVFKEF